MFIESKPLTVTEVLVAGNRGPCGGVKMAIEAADQVLDIVGGREPVYTNWDIVNNTPIMERLKARMLINVQNDWDLVPDGSVVFFSAHGVPPSYKEIAQQRDFLTIDVTCQLVNRVHTLVKNAQNQGKHIVYLGKEGHPETVGVLGELDKDNTTFLEPASDITTLVLPKDKEVVVYSQTTLATDEVKGKQAELKSRFPGIIIPNRWDICPAVDARQMAAEDLLNNQRVDFWLVGGSPHSHNSLEVKRKGEKRDIPSVLIDSPIQIKRGWFTNGVKVVGATSGASEAEEDFQKILDWFRAEGIDPIVYLPKVVDENDKTFKLPQSDIDKLMERYQ
jgi:4-hydroxy-3-methylbut-2-enyl diphosphate reductase